MSPEHRQQVVEEMTKNYPLTEAEAEAAIDRSDEMFAAAMRSVASLADGESRSELAALILFFAMMLQESEMRLSIAKVLLTFGGSQR